MVTWTAYKAHDETTWPLNYFRILVCVRCKGLVSGFRMFAVRNRQGEFLPMLYPGRKIPAKDVLAWCYAPEKKEQVE